MRLDKYLTTKYPRLSRAYIKTQIKSGNFVVNNKKEKPSYELREGDTVAFAPGFILPKTAQILPNPNIKLDIIYKDANVLVINKPAGLSVHPRQDKNGQPLLSEIDSTLVSGLLAYYPKITNVEDIDYNSSHPPLNLRGGVAPPLKLRGGEGALCSDKNFIQNVRPGLVHRLDKDTSGVMIIAKNQNSFDWLKKQFKERQVSKTYLALVHGKLKNKEGEIKTLLRRAASNPTKQIVQLGAPTLVGELSLAKARTPNATPSQSPPQLRGRGKIREAITQYKVVKDFKDYSLLEVSPKTGRLHQIRVHLAHLGHPVAGDKKYGHPKFTSPVNLSRQFLHAEKLKIILPNGQEKTFNAPLPNELQSILDDLERKGRI